MLCASRGESFFREKGKVENTAIYKAAPPLRCVSSPRFNLLFSLYPILAMRKVIPCLILSLLAGSLLAQTPKDATVPIVAAISVNPPGIALQWANPVASDLLILRRTKGQAGNQWVQLLNLANSPANAGIDANVVAGQTYEYYI